MARPRDARRWVGVFLAVLAAAVLVGFGYINSGLNTYLPHVSNDQSVRPGQAKDTTWFVLLAVWSVAMFLSAGFPEGGLNAKGWAGGAVVQGLSGLIAAAGVCLAGALFNIGPADLEENPCRYAGSCWPHDPQLYAWIAPGLVGALAMVVMALPRAVAALVDPRPDPGRAVGGRRTDPARDLDAGPDADLHRPAEVALNPPGRTGTTCTPTVDCGTCDDPAGAWMNDPAG